MLFSAVILAEVLNVGLALSARTPSQSRRQADCSSTDAWPGWESVKHAFIFGDSYTQTGFDYKSTNPTPSNPLGNPPYPGWTSSNGPNWVGFLTTKYNSSVLQTYNLAYGGATVDSELVKPYNPSVISMKEQIRSQFLPGYTGDSPTAPNAPEWKSEDSVFGFWIGINDVGNSWWFEEPRLSELYDKIFTLYADLVTQIYDAGGRNFVFLNVPPVDRSPMMINQGPEAAEGEKKIIARWNELVEGMAAGLKATHADDVNVWIYNTNESFGEVLDDPTTFEATADMKNVTDFCQAYSSGTPEWDTFTPNCGVPVNEYFWLNDLHPTYPIHDVVAQGVADGFVEGPNVCN